jgi:hypothetical protein
MAGNITLNPMLVTNASGYFSSTTEGLTQGVFYDDPSTRFALAGGSVATTETYPMWGGIGITELIPASTANPVLGPTLARATSNAAANSGQLTGFTLFNQAHAMIATPQSPVPLAPVGASVNFGRLGSGMRITLACDPALASYDGGVITQNVSWDFVNQLLVPYIGTLTISSGTYNNTTGVVVLTMSATIAFSAGDAIIISSLTGTGAYASLNGTFTAIPTTSGTTVTYNAGAGLGASTITGGSLTLGSGASSALPVKVLEIDTTNARTVLFNTSTGFATWNNNGAAAVVLI